MTRKCDSDGRRTTWLSGTIGVRGIAQRTITVKIAVVTESPVWARRRIWIGGARAGEKHWGCRVAMMQIAHMAFEDPGKRVDFVYKRVSIYRS